MPGLLPTAQGLMLQGSRFRFIAAAAAVSAGLLAGESARGLVINVTYDSTVTSAANSAQIQSGFAYAAQQFTSRYSDPITINITVAAGTTGLGGSSTQLAGFYTYTQIRNALIADATTANDASAVSTLPVVDPTGGHNYATSTAQAKALSLTGASTNNDGTYTFNNTLSYTFDPNNRAVAGKYDFIGVSMHEISEIMGRIPGLGANFGDGGPDYLPFDLFRYTAAGTRNFTNGNGIYFSINNGTTNLKNFNFPNGNGSDPQDWASGTNDSFNAFTGSGVQNDLTPVDITTMDVIGYDLIPEPSGIFASLLFYGGAALRRRRRA